MTTIRALLLLLLTAQSAQTQPVSIGLKAGIPLTNAVAGNFGGSSEASRYTVGPMLELRLPASLAVEAGALYKRTGYRASQSDSGITIRGQVRAASWEFPMLIKFYLPMAARPFVEAGYVIRRISKIEGTAHISRDLASGTPIDATFSVPASTILRDDPTHGLTAGIGFRPINRPLRVSPEIRYTRWTGRPFDDQGPRGFFLQSTRNQVELLIGVSF
jgi:Outer membrane protein beta-barrel domain